MSEMFRSLRVRNYRLFASGQLVSLAGTWMQRTAQDWLVLRLSHNSGAAIGITTGLQFLPLLLFGLYGGVIADRFPKRKLLVGTQSFMALCALALGILDASGQVTLYEVYVLAFLLGVGTAVDNPVRQAFVSEMVGVRDVANAISLNSATFNTSRIIGPALAGVLIESVGTSVLFFCNAVSFFAVIAGLLLMREEELHSRARLKRAKGQLREGLRYVWSRKELLVPIFLVGVVGTFGLNFQVTLALMDKTVFHRGAAGYGFLTAIIALGSLAGALAGARRERPKIATLLATVVAFGAAEIACGLMPSYPLLALLLLPSGFFVISFSTAANSFVQLNSDGVMRGRVMGVYMLVFLGGTPLGAPVIGWLSQSYGARWGLIIGGLFSLGAGALAAGAIALHRRDKFGRARKSRAATARDAGNLPAPVPQDVQP